MNDQQADERPDRNLALELVRVTEAAALAAARLVGRGDKEGADQAAVDAMRFVLDSVPMDGVVVIGEGEKDEAPMLYNGEQIGDGSPPEVDVAVDPLEGTRLTALGMPSALAVIALAERGTMFDPGPCVYMEKIAGGPEIADLLDLDRPLPETLRAGRRAQGDRHPRRDGGDARPRAPRTRRCAEVREAGARVRLIIDGDVSAALLAVSDELAGRPAVGDRRDARGRDLGGRDQVHGRPAARPPVAARRRRAPGARSTPATTSTEVLDVRRPGRRRGRVLLGDRRHRRRRAAGRALPGRPRAPRPSRW